MLYEKLAVPLIADLVPRLLCTQYAALSTYVKVSSSNMFHIGCLDSTVNASAQHLLRKEEQFIG